MTTRQGHDLYDLIRFFEVGAGKVGCKWSKKRKEQKEEREDKNMETTIQKKKKKWLKYLVEQM